MSVIIVVVIVCHLQALMTDNTPSLVLGWMEAPGMDSGLGVCVERVQVYGTDLHRRLSISPALNIHL